VVQRVPESFGGLSGKRPPGGIGDRSGNHHRPAPTDLFEVLFDGKQRGLGVQRVENGLDQHQVGAAFAESAHGFGVGGDQFVEAGIAVAGVVDVGRDRRGARGRPDDAGDKAGPGRVAGGELVAHRPRQLRAGDIQLMHDGFEVVIGLRNAGRVEGVGFDDVRASRQILGVNRADEIGRVSSSRSLLPFRSCACVGEAAAAVIRLLQPMALDHRSHRAVENEDVLFEAGFQFGGTVRLHGYPLCYGCGAAKQKTRRRKARRVLQSVCQIGAGLALCLEFLPARSSSRPSRKTQREAAISGWWVNRTARQRSMIAMIAAAG
jgi:hypothetical protein